MIIKCVECEKDFEFTESEQLFYKEKGLVNLPKRCEDCRARKKMNSQKNGKNLPTHSYPATCSRCGHAFNAPFQPKLDRAVLCKECYLKHKS